MGKGLFSASISADSEQYFGTITNVLRFRFLEENIANVPWKIFILITVYLFWRPEEDLCNYKKCNEEQLLIVTI